jgi:hypothetical protein
MCALAAFFHLRSVSASRFPIVGPPRLQRFAHRRPVAPSGTRTPRCSPTRGWVRTKGRAAQSGSRWEVPEPRTPSGYDRIRRGPGRRTWGGSCFGAGGSECVSDPVLATLSFIIYHLESNGFNHASVLFGGHVDADRPCASVARIDIRRRVPGSGISGPRRLPWGSRGGDQAASRPRVRPAGMSSPWRLWSGPGVAARAAFLGSSASGARGGRPRCPITPQGERR